VRADALNLLQIHGSNRSHPFRLSKKRPTKRKHDDNLKALCIATQNFSSHRFGEARGEAADFNKFNNAVKNEQSAKFKHASQPTRTKARVLGEITTRTQAGEEPLCSPTLEIQVLKGFDYEMVGCWRKSDWALSSPCTHAAVVPRVVHSQACMARFAGPV